MSFKPVVIDRLTKEQKESLLAELQLDLGKHDMDFSADEMMLWDAACTAASNRVTAPRQPIKTVVGRKDNMSAREYRSRCAYIIEFMNQACGKKLDRTERIVMAEILFESLSRYMRGWMKSISAKTIFDCYESIPLAIDEDYPMYAECRLLGHLIEHPVIV